MYHYKNSSKNQMKYPHINSIGKKKKEIVILTSIFIILFFFNLPNISRISDNNQKRTNTDSNNFRNPRMSSDLPNSRPLLVHQHSSISRTYFPLSLPTNISFTLVDDWTSKNVTIIYDGVSHRKDWVTNGTFDIGTDPWDYNTSDVSAIYNNSLQDGFIEIDVGKNKVNLPNGSFGYFEENITIPDTLASNTIGSLSMDYKYALAAGGTDLTNASAFISIIIGDVEKNTSVSFIDLVKNQISWTKMSINYDLTDANQQLPENISMRAGVYVDDLIPTTGSKIHNLSIDNIQFTVWTSPNSPNLLLANDTEFGLNYSYSNTTFGKAYAFIDVERSKNVTSDIIFTISKNSTYTEDFEVYNITITSEAVKTFNSTIHGEDGSLYTNDLDIEWETEATITIPFGYLNNWAEIIKPDDWDTTSILDGFGVEEIGSCTGINLGSERIIIPNGVLSSGLWTFEFVSWNYIVKGGIIVWNGTSYNEQSSITLGDKFQINGTLNNTISFSNSQVNCTIEYPNGTTFWQTNQTLGSYNINFGDFTVGLNMSVGNYQTTLIWTNNQNVSKRDKVGFLQFGFNVWHQTDLTAVNPDEVKVSGEPYLMKVEYRDYDLNQSIDFATIIFNSTYGASGTMVYLGSGLYFFDVDLSSLLPGDFYFSFNASKNYYENQSIWNLIHLTIITQPLAIETPPSVIDSMANDYAICQINVTGALTDVPIYPANVSTDWQNPYSKIDHSNGTYTLNFSTYNLPALGIVKTYTISIYANKTNYGSTYGFISITIRPIPTVINVNETIVDVYINRNFYLEVNYTEEVSSAVINGATLNVSWASFYNITPVANGFIINLSTINLSLAIYTILLELNHPGHESGFKNVYVNVIPRTTSLKIFLNQEDKTSDRSLSIPGNEPLNITVTYRDTIINSFIYGATVELNGSGISDTLTENGQQYSIIFNPGDLPVGIHFLSITAQKDDYSIAPSIIKITVDQIEIHVETIGINGTIELFAGASFTISINLTEQDFGKLIENANISYSWLSYLDEDFTNMGDGIYEAQIKIPGAAEGAYTIHLIIIIEGSNYKNLNFPLNIYVLQKPTPNYLVLIILGVSIPVIGVLSALSLRSYVIIPRKRKKERVFMNTIQVFKDVKNIQAVMFIQRSSGLPFFNKNYANFDSKDDSLLSGFIQAITIFGEQMIMVKYQMIIREKVKKYILKIS